MNNATTIIKPMKTCLTFFLLLILMSAQCWSDGGVLKFNPNVKRVAREGPWQDSGVWYLKSVLLPTPFDKGPLKNQAFLFRLTEKDLSLCFYSPVSGEKLLYADTDNDWNFEPDGNGFPMNSAYIPISAAGSLCSVTGVVDIETNFLLHGETRLSVKEIFGAYDGKVDLMGNTYSARLFFLGPFAEPSKLTNEIIVLDTDADGLFSQTLDWWFSSQGIVSFQNSLFTARTNFSEATAAVSLTPYSGPTGSLSLDGEGNYRAVSRAEGIVDESSASFDPYLLYLHATSNQVVALPPGKYELRDALLKEETGTYAYKRLTTGGQQQVSVVPNSVTPCPLGGPLIGALQMTGPSTSPVTFWDVYKLSPKEVASLFLTPLLLEYTQLSNGSGAYTAGKLSNTGEMIPERLYYRIQKDDGHIEAEGKLRVNAYSRCLPGVIWKPWLVPGRYTVTVPFNGTLGKITSCSFTYYGWGSLFCLFYLTVGFMAIWAADRLSHHIDWKSWGKYISILPALLGIIIWCVTKMWHDDVGLIGMISIPLEMVTAFIWLCSAIPGRRIVISLMTLIVAGAIVGTHVGISDLDNVVNRWLYAASMYSPFLTVPFVIFLFMVRKRFTLWRGLLAIFLTLAIALLEGAIFMGSPRFENYLIAFSCNIPGPFILLLLCKWDPWVRKAVTGVEE